LIKKLLSICFVQNQGEPTMQLCSSWWTCVLLNSLLSAWLWVTGTFAGIVALQPSQDTTLYEDAEGLIANGVGAHLFAGRNGQNRIQRGLVRFDLSTVAPAGAVGRA
jgi:hypothetical protein